jgi:UDP-N-acetylmuramoyl-L-alanyl-D-glutamate--2,6-diaminopimelate ligase
MEYYFQAKKKLFTGLDKEALAILNRDDITYERLKKEIKGKILSYGFYPKADIVCQNLELLPEGLKLSIKTPAGECQIRSRLLGRFNAYNIMAAVSCAIGLGFDLELITKGVENTSAVPGRMEQVEGAEDFTVVVDYAHTDDAMKNILSTCREFCTGKLIVVFGCGGDRDRGKRRRMGEVAGKLSDYTILTSDNPRTEDPLSIINEIEKGVKTTGKDYEVIPERRQAIEKAIGFAGKGDVVVLAGKGHEDYQILGQKRIPFDDRLVAADFLKKTGKAINLHI